MEALSPTFGKVWLALMQSHDHALQQLIEAEVVKGNTGRQAPLADSGQIWNPKARFAHEGVGPALEAKYEDHISGLTAQLTAIVTANLTEVAATAALTAATADSVSPQLKAIKFNDLVH